jgi:acetyltransferase-like isoleucine patch superfamily enzyme
MLLRKIARAILLPIGIELKKLDHRIAEATLPTFANDPQNVRIDLPRRILNPQNIFLGDDVWLGPGTFLNAMTHYPTVSMQHPDRDQPQQTFQSKIIIGNRVTSTADLQIAAQQEVVIEEDVMFASNIHINDGLHGYEHANEPYKYQKIFRIAPILIKRGSWIGQNVVILPGVTIGELSIIGANSVVTKSVPDRCIAFGSPAEVVREWDEPTRQWLPVERSRNEGDTRRDNRKL